MWTSVHEEAFLILKKALSTTLVLALPDFTKTFVIETDASDKMLELYYYKMAILWHILAELCGQIIRCCQPMKKSVWLYSLQLTIGDHICIMLNLLSR